MKSPAPKSPLLIIAEHRPSALLDKGEYIPRYYNPGDLFDEVTLFLVNDDEPDPKALQFTVGNARLNIIIFPPPNLIWSFGWTKPLITNWVRRALEKINVVNPALIRVHNNFLGGYLAKRAKQELGIPYVLSLHHQHWEQKKDQRFRSWASAQVLKKFERSPLEKADAVIAIHQPVADYAQSINSKNVRQIYNVVFSDITQKSDYALSKPMRLVTINQQIPLKSPENILRAIEGIECELDVFGDGPEHEKLRSLARELGISKKVNLIRSIPNGELVQRLSSYDMMLCHNAYWGIPKSIIEASLAGLPIISSRHLTRQIPEYASGWLMLVDDNPADYAQAITTLAKDDLLREQFGQNALGYGRKNFNPRLMETRLAELYQSLAIKSES